ELRAASDRCAFAFQLHDRAGLLVEARVDAETAERRLTAAAAFLNLQALFAQDVLGFLHIAPGLREGLLAVHHWQACFFTQLTDMRGGYFGHINSPAEFNVQGSKFKVARTLPSSTLNRPVSRVPQLGTLYRKSDVPFLRLARAGGCHFGLSWLLSFLLQG